LTFKQTYDLMGNTLACEVFRLRSPLKRETTLEALIKNVSRPLGWKFHNIENMDQNGTPDVLLLRRAEYWFIECKMLKVNRLMSVLDNLKWQPGQLPYMKRAQTLKLNYMLAVGHRDQVAILKGVFNDYTLDNPDFIRQIGIRQERPTIMEGKSGGRFHTDHTP